MAAIIVRGKRSYFEEFGASSSGLSASASSSGVSSASLSAKGIRCPSFRFSAPRQWSGALIEQLGLIFPGMDKELLEKTLQECGDDLDSAIKSLYELRLRSANNHFNSSPDRPDAALGTNDAHVQSHDDQTTLQNSPRPNAEWVELFVREMASTTNMDNARGQAIRALKLLEKSILAGAAGEVSQLEKDYDDKSQELNHLRQLISQYKEQRRTLEANNYTLTMHLEQALQRNSTPGRFKPNVF